MTSLRAVKVSLQEILPLRNLFLQENNFQIRYDACHRRGWSDSYLLIVGEEKVGYGSVKGNEKIEDRDTVFEFYVIPFYRNLASALFSALLQASGVNFLECQSNVLLLTALIYEFGENINSDTVLFEDDMVTMLHVDEAIFRTRKDDDVIFEHKAEPIGDYLLELHGEVVATGGFLLHYNIPFADLYMEVKEEFRRKGLGSFLIQELKKQCYLEGRVPAARTGFSNVASKATLIKAGLKIAGVMLLGYVKTLADGKQSND